MEEKASPWYKNPGTVAFAIVLILVGVGLLLPAEETGEMGMDGHRLAFLEKRDHIQGTLLSKGEYACCLDKPCTYCIEKTPGHGEGASCHCLTDIVEGRHPCGECIGEIMEGHGNEHLKEYFAPAIAEEVGEEHLETLQQIMDQKYPE